MGARARHGVMRAQQLLAAGPGRKAEATAGHRPAYSVNNFQFAELRL